MQSSNRFKVQREKLLKMLKTATGKINLEKPGNSPLKTAVMQGIKLKNKISILVCLVLVLAIILPAYLTSCSTPKLSFGEIVISESVEKNTNMPVNPKSE